MPELAPVSIPIQFPEKMQCLFEPKRFKVFYGGRGASRSWSCARALLLLGTQRPIRVLCAREFQNSISESVHKVLSDQIEKLGLSAHYDIQAAKIFGKNGTSFSFEGIKNNTTRIKSYEGVDYCWVEEAVKVSKASWNVLIPTIRKSGSEIWLTFNPELETDYTYTRFVVQADLSRSFVVKMTYADNPWFAGTELQEEMEADRVRAEQYDEQDQFLHVWEGNCLQQLEGAVYAKELRRATREGRILRVPYHREVPIDCWWDLGRADRTAIWFGQRVSMEYRLVDYFEDSGEDITYYLRELQGRGYVYGTMWLPHDAKAKKLITKRSIEEIVRHAGYDVKIVPKLSVVDGINAARVVFPNCYFDEENCADGLTALRRYRYKVTDGQLSNDPLHDAASDGADAFRYFALSCGVPRSDSSGVSDRLAQIDAARLAAREREAATTGLSGRLRRAALGWMG